MWEHSLMMQYFILWQWPQKNKGNMLLLGWGLEAGSCLKVMALIKVGRNARIAVADGRKKNQITWRSMHVQV